MSQREFTRLTQRVLARLGKDSLLRGTDAGQVNIEHGVQFTGIGENGVFERSVATIDNAMNPQVGDKLTHPDGTFKLDSKIGNNGYSSRYILIPYSGP